MGLEEENEKLRTTIRELVDDYTQQLLMRDRTIQGIESDKNYRDDSIK
jgi:hypothetical protein